MLCPECGKRPAILHYTKIVNGQKHEFHLCEVCAQEKGEYMPPLESNFSFHQLLSGLLDIGSSGSSASAPNLSGKVLRCPTCGLTHTQFSKSGRFGCTDCYETFKTRLNPLLKRIHGHSRHTGKIPERTQGEVKLQRRLKDLKEELTHKISIEEFEEAAKIRDKIRNLQDKLN